jgi:8-oxo-dGTP pyrophosphatase MutT (NUDIX family)
MERNQTNPEDQAKKEFTAGLIVYRNTPQGPRFLLLYHGGRYWNFPKGHIENRSDVVASFGGDIGAVNTRETSKEAAIRETHEETGISPEKLSIKRNFRAVEKFRFRHNREQIFKIVIFYLAETSETEVKISSEHEGFGWFQYKDARNILALNKSSQRLLRNAYEQIRPRLPLRTKPNPSRPQDGPRQSPPKPSGQA